MGFMDKAKAAANELAAKADTALAGSGLGGPGGGAASPERLFRDLGVISYLEATGRPAPEGERERILGALREAEQRGGIPSFALQTAAPAPGTVPPPPGAAGMGQPPPPPGGAAPPPPAPGAPTPASAPTPAAPVPPSAPPPPPPSWAKPEDGG